MSTVKTHPLIADHTAAVAAYDEAAKLVPSDDLSTNQIGAHKASAVRAINNAELEMVIEGITGWTPWVAPRKAQTRTHSRSDADLLARLSTIEAIRDDANHPNSIRNTADNQARTLRRQAIARGLIEGEETPEEETPAAPKSGKTAGQMLDDVAAKVPPKAKVTKGPKVAA